uniref:tRNA (cytidine(34)-2'-O)-methyltransferase n=1 Tax=Sandarakinorhabdus sp. TaxID=1916663 RepID=UPI00286D72B3
NVGAVLRLGACLGVPVDLIEPLGFAWDDARVRRTAMDYIDRVAITRHADWAAFHASIGTARRLVLLTTKGSNSAHDFTFRPDDVLLFGKESAGAPPHVHAACEGRIRLPMRVEVRSLNLAMSAGLAVGEALRQTGGLPR